MLVIIFHVLESIGLPLLGTLMKTLAAKAQDSGISNDALAYLGDLVDSSKKNSALTTDDQRWSWVFAEFDLYLKKNGISLAMEMIDSLIGLAIHHKSATQG